MLFNKTLGFIPPPLFVITNSPFKRSLSRLPEWPLAKRVEASLPAAGAAQMQIPESNKY